MEKIRQTSSMDLPSALGNPKIRTPHALEPASRPLVARNPGNNPARDQLRRGLTPRTASKSNGNSRTMFTGVSVALPRQSITQDQAAVLAAQLSPQARGDKLIRAVYRRSGVEQHYSVLLDGTTDAGQPRQTFYQPTTEHDLHGPTTAQRMIAYGRYATPFAFQAAAAALQEAAIAPHQVTHLVTVSCTGFQAPGVDLQLIDMLKLSADVQRTYVGFMGCHGALNGMRIARAIATSEPGACVLLCAVELCSLHHQFTNDAEQIVANSLFGDGAAACIVRNGDGGDSSAGRSCELRGQASHEVAETADLMSWNIADHGFCMTLSPKVPETIRLQLRPWLERFLARYELTVERVPHWAIHPGGPRILSAVAEALALDEMQMHPSREILRNYGNMSSPTVMFILSELLSQSARGPCMLLAFGPGLSIEAALVELGG